LCHEPAAINIRNIPPELYLAVKVAAAKRGLTLKAYVLQVLSDRIAVEKAKEKRKGRN
jgi:plasmid stability protein